METVSFVMIQCHFTVLNVFDIRIPGNPSCGYFTCQGPLGKINHAQSASSPSPDARTNQQDSPVGEKQHLPGTLGKPKLSSNPSAPTAEDSSHACNDH